VIGQMPPSSPDSSCTSSSLDKSPMTPISYASSAWLSGKLSPPADVQTMQQFQSVLHYSRVASTLCKSPPTTTPLSPLNMNKGMASKRTKATRDSPSAVDRVCANRSEADHPFGPSSPQHLTSLACLASPWRLLELH
jgi:hypothetical protein